MLCADQDLADVMQAVQNETGDELLRLDRLIQQYREDPRLHFLRGSILAGIGRPIEALSSFREAVKLAPDFAIARFQLGFFLLTSGEAAEALSVWGPIALLPDGHYLRLFVGGLTHLIRDEFPETIAQLEAGIASNQDNPPLNRDMQLIIGRVRQIESAGPAAGSADSSMSATSLLLGQLTGSGRPH
jgi:tetratricopeptide (TPR) repeat protein